MPANMWDNSATILGNRTGEIWGNAFANLGTTIAAGITAYRQKKKEEEANDAAVQWLKKNGQAMGLDSTDEGELKAAVKAAGGGRQAIQLISGLESAKQQRAQAEQQRQVTAAQLQHLQDQRQQLMQSRGAAQLATGGTPGMDETGALIQGGAGFRDLTPSAGGNPDSVVLDYLRRSGDTGGAGNLAETFGRLGVLNNKTREPYAVDLGGIPGVVANGNFIPDPRLRNKPTAPATQKVDIGGGKSATVGPGNHYFDEKGNPIQLGADRPPVAPDIFLQKMDPELYQAMRTQYLDYVNRRGGEASSQADQPATAPAAPSKAAAPGGAVEISTKEELDKLKKGTRFRWFDGRIGIKN